MKPHIVAAHSHWDALLQPGDLVVDATCGNGHDTLYLAKAVLTEDTGHVYAIDIQRQAITNTRILLEEELNPKLLPRVTLIESCHSKLHDIVKDNTIKLIVYNLGYLPKSDKSIKTRTKSTIDSLVAAMNLLAKGGMICITCYPGHDEGFEEEIALVNFVKMLPSNEWQCCYQKWLNRERSPSLLTIKFA